ncbi:MAG: type I-C CRISPR-associated protein Cas8c/Csd1 [Oscillospiraceae bacterium]|nr:type I-C CRISPR-associated protein Cas8c/Csd1 [Oscillospiraceae bacterium]
MGLFQKAVETYDAHSAYIGKQLEGHQVLAPVGHTVKNADLEITLNEDGTFHSAIKLDKTEPKIVMPVTEESEGRTSGACAHPLCDQLCYLADYNDEKHRLYVDQLTDWAGSEHSHPMLHPILTYVKGGTILQDLSQMGLIELDDKGQPKKEKLMVRWRISGMGAASGSCWTNKALFDAFLAWYTGKRAAQGQQLCMITGSMDIPAQQHSKGIIPINGNAKLISANDTSGFTYRGRFTEDSQAASISYQASQKAHNALRWLAAEQGVIQGGRTFLCWNPEGKKTASPLIPLLSRTSPASAKPTNYREQLLHTLSGWKSELPEASDGVVIAAFDAATTGRLALTYYNELMGSDFLDRLYQWDSHCCWYNGKFGIQSPALWQIVSCAFGTRREENGTVRLETDDKVMRQQVQRLLSCRVDRAMMSMDIEKALVQRASNLLVYGGSIRETMLFVTCAVIKKYYDDRNCKNNDKEGYEMELIPDKNDRSYQFGRLLAVKEKVERDTYDSDEVREPGAVQMQSVFCQRPLYAAGVLEKQLERAYFPRLRPGARVYYKNLIGQILEQIHGFPEWQWNRPLEDTYLMGYYLQRKALYTKKEDPDNANDTDDSEQTIEND